MSAFVASLTIIIVSLALGAGLAPELLAIVRGRHFAGVRRYMHDDPTDPMRPGDRAWVRAVVG